MHIEFLPICWSRGHHQRGRDRARPDRAVRTRRRLRGLRHRSVRRRLPGLRFDVVSIDGRPVRTKSGFHITPTGGLELVEDADLVAVPAHVLEAPVPECVLDALRAAHARGAWILSVCSGAFVLGEAGLLDGRRCTTHWQYADELARRFPLADVALNALYVEDDRVLTSAGTAAGIDACLHLVRKVHGSGVAPALARRMVVPPHRDGGQAQFVEAPMPRAEATASLGPAADLGDRASRRTDHSGRSRRADPHGAAHLRAPVPDRGRRDAARLADHTTGSAGPAAFSRTPISAVESVASTPDSATRPRFGTISPVGSARPRTAIDRRSAHEHERTRPLRARRRSD